MSNKWFIIFLLTCLVGMNSKAQQGEIRGVIVDSAYKLKLPAATVAVYTEDSTLVQFTLTNNFGAFTLKSIPLHKTLRLYASYTGYRIAAKTFTLDSLQLTKDFKSINVTRDSIMLKTFVVKSVVPVRMNGDTLEFNADAFKLDKNAVVEDLLRKLPAVTIWGDGTITVNGKKVSNVYVEGKPFFSGDPKIALQNLEKTSVSKIQVYNDVQPDKFSDTVKNMNIVLKDDKKTGYFGKVGAGKSLADNLHDVDLAFNWYAPQTQVGIAGNHNAVNKRVNSLNQVFLNSTFKGNLTDDYSTDFSMLGENKSTAAGVFINRDFMKKPELHRSHQISGEYFYNKTLTDIRNATQQTYNFRPDSIQQNEQSEFQHLSPESHQLSMSYQSKKEERQFEVTLNASNLQNRQIRDQHSITSRNGEQAFKRNEIYQENNTANSFNFQTGYDTRNSASLKAFKGMKIQFSYNYREENEEGIKKSVLSSLENPTAGQLIDRKFNGVTKKNSLGSKMESDVSRLVLWRLFERVRINLTVSNELNYTATKRNAGVLQYDTLQKAYLINGYLSNARQYNLLEETPSLAFSRAFNKVSANRYSKSLSFKLQLPLAMRFEQSRSEKSFQNYSLDYTNLLPSLAISYTNSRIGKHQQRIGFEIVNSMSYPEIHMIAPLVDSTYDVIQVGNPMLKAGKKLSYILAYNNSYRDFKFSVTASIDKLNNALTTNTTFDEFNRRFLTYRNALRNNTSGNMELKLQNSYKLNLDNQLQVEVLSRNIKYQVTNYFSGSQNIVDGIYSSNEISVNYTFKTLIQLKGSQAFNFNDLKHSYLKSGYKISTWVSYVNLQVTPIQNIFVRTDLRYTRQQAAFSSIPFTIWNATAGCRLLNKRNLELKFSAMDLLKQNQSVRNIINDLYVNLSSTNMLQQYFMMSVAYYPRKSGKGKIN